GLAELECLLDGILVELAQQAIDVHAVGRVVGGVEPPLGLGVRNVLDADDDVHSASFLVVLLGLVCLLRSRWPQARQSGPSSQASRRRPTSQVRDTAHVTPPYGPRHVVSAGPERSAEPTVTRGGWSGT